MSKVADIDNLIKFIMDALNEKLYRCAAPHHPGTPAPSPREGTGVVTGARGRQGRPADLRG